MANEKDGGKAKKEKPEGLVVPPKKPKLTKAERRALQEAQRAAKAAGKGGEGKAGGGAKKQPKDQQQQQASGGSGNKKQSAQQQQQQQQQQQPSKKEESQKEEHQPTKTESESIFSHLPPARDMGEYEEGFSGASLGTKQHKDLHPKVLELGLLYASGRIRGGNARCRTMLECFSDVLEDYQPPKDCRDVRAHLDQHILKPSFSYWAEDCRPHSVSMGNAFTFLKSAVASLDRDMSLEEMVTMLQETTKAYVQERLEFADQVISDFASTKIVDGDVILTYAHSSVVELLLKKASTEKKFRVVVADSRPLLEGKKLLKSLREAGIECCYILMNSLSYIMKDVTKVFLGASALMSDGSVLSRVGTACVALLAQSSNKPVLVCCETYKMSNRVQLESITGNELGSPQFVVSKDLQGYRDQKNLMLLNLLYDLTPSNVVSGIVTEMGILPPTSVAVLLRELNPEGRAN